MKTYIIGFFVTLLTTLVLDGIWLSTMLKTFYAKNFSGVLEMKSSLTPAIIFYIIYTLGVLYFVVLPLLNAQTSYLTVFLTGAFFGLVAYGTYDLTNHATIKNWPAIVTIVDLAWGAFLTGTVATVTVWIIRLFKLM